uniref:TVP38/TMEM64 family protein n=1 Tax=Desulfonatronospira sp. TaxID=1962951 RepID=UPI0025BD3A09
YIEKGMQEYGTGFLFMLRIIEVAPSFVINSVFAFTDMRVKTFFLVSLAGFLPGIFIFANAGSRLAQIDAMSCLMSTGVMLSLAAVGIFPLLCQLFCKKYKSLPVKSS